jgi:hypothetical protein
MSTFAQNEYELTDAQMKKAAPNLHARARKEIAARQSKEFRGDIEAILRQNKSARPL